MPNNINTLLGYLYSLQTRGIKPGLERVRRFLKSLGNPEATFPTLHIAGTNGKGTVCHILYSILRAAGYRVGRYTSPHLMRFNERVVVNEQEITDEKIVEFVLRNRNTFDQEKLTFFEITTALAFEHFAHEKPDVAIIETGMGGRLDATNVLTPEVSIITDISMDHEAFLGNNIEQIAMEKAGILKKGVPAVMGVQHVDAKRTILKHCPDCLDAFSESRIHLLKETETGTTFDFQLADKKLPALFLPLPSAHQLRNAQLALTALYQTRFAPTLEHVRSGLSRVQIPGRLELKKGTPSLLLDVAHNPQKIRGLNDYLERFFPDQNIHFIFGVMGDKNYADMLNTLNKPKRSFFFCKPNTERAADPARLLPLVKKGICFGPVQEAYQAAMHHAEKEDLVVITGSFHTVGEIEAG